MLRRAASALCCCLAVVLLGPTAAWAAPTPAPLPSQNPATPTAVIASEWSCETTTATAPGAVETQACAVTAWATMAPWPQYVPPSSQPVTLAGPLPVIYDGSSPIPVRETSQEQQAVSLSCSPSATPSASPSPQPSPSATSEPASSPCLVTASVESGQWIALSVVLGTGLLLSLATFLRREGKSFRD